jgi:hypothetical protein
VYLYCFLTNAFAQPVYYDTLFNAQGPTEYSYFGNYLVSAGDQNDDGADEILVYCFDTINNADL